MVIEKLDMKHQELLRSKAKDVRRYFSEYSFANLYLFRNSHRYYYVAESGIDGVLGLSYNQDAVLIPFLDVAVENVERLVSFYDDISAALGEGRFEGFPREGPLHLFPVHEENLNLFTQRGFSPLFLEGESDYIFRLDKLREYPGKKLHSKRNLVKQFLEEYPVEVKPLLRENRGDALGVLETWQENVGSEKEDTDYTPCSDAIRNSEELILCGLVYYIEEKPAGFVLGDEINNDSFVTHFVKGLKEYKGIYQYMFQDFARCLPEKYDYINMEQDLGNPSLRQSKMSYRPDLLLRKYRIRRV